MCQASACHLANNKFIMLHYIYIFYLYYMNIPEYMLVSCIYNATSILFVGATIYNIEDFWRMIWEIGITTIVMLTNVKEQDKVHVSQLLHTLSNFTSDIKVCLFLYI